jgi:ElaB/YqjD/DUF883 family membrane-anchored ribosome-binding protein
MNTTSTASPNARETAKEAREGVRDFRRTAFEASGDIQKELQALREEFTQFADQVSGIFANRGSAGWERAKSSVEGVVSEAEQEGREAADAVREVADHFLQALDESLKTRPYTTLALVAGVAFLFGSTWHR